MISYLDTSLLEKVTYNSAAMKKVREEVDPLVQSAVPILFWGETGSGAAFYARAIHKASREGEFLRIPCISLEEDKAKGQIFGIDDQSGWLEQANNGTILFRLIGGSSPTTQQILHQLLSIQSVDGRLEFSRVGRSKRIEMNVRFIYSLSGNFDTMIQDGLLNRDLVDLLRRKGKIIQLPPLRERKEDIFYIARNFFEALNRNRNQKISSIDPKARKLLAQYYWPGNIDELKQVITNIFSQYLEIKTISPEHIPEHIKNPKITRDKYIFKLKDGAKITGKLLSQSLSVQDKKKYQINTSDLAEIIRVDDDRFAPPRFKHFALKLKDGSQLAVLILDKTITVETSFNPSYQIDVQNLDSIKLS